MYGFVRLFVFFVMGSIIMSGISLMVRQRGFDIIAYLFYDEKYLDIGTWDLSPAPYWGSLILGLFLIIFPIWILIKNANEL